VPRSGQPCGSARLAKVSKVACLAHTKLTFGRRVLCSGQARLHDAAPSRGESAKAAFYQPLPGLLAARPTAAQCSCQHLPPAVRRRRVSALDRIRRVPKGKVDGNLPEIRGFPALPDSLAADVVRRGRDSEGSEARPQPSTGHSAPTQQVCARKSPTHSRREGTKKAERARTGAPAFVHGFLTADEAATT